MGLPYDPPPPPDYVPVEKQPWQAEAPSWVYEPGWDPLEQRRRDRKEQIGGVKRVLKRFGAICSLSLFAYLALAVALFLMIGPEIMRHISSAGYYDYLFVVTPAIVPIYRMDGAVIVAYFMLVALAITATYVYIALGSALPTIKEAILGSPGKHSTMLTVGGLFFAADFIIYVNYLLVDIAGASPNTPNFGAYPVWDQIYGFATASVWEEIISRVLLIGVPLLWIDLLFRRKALLPPRKYLLGGVQRYGGVEVGLVVFSAFMFGMGHIWSWDVWKVTPTIIVGLCFGYLFIRFGLYASIMFHLCFNFLSVPTYFISEGQTMMVDLMILFVWMPAGVMFMVYYILRMTKFLRAPKKVEIAPTAESP